MPLALNIGKCSLLGNYRENNEDSIEVKQFPDLIGLRGRRRHGRPGRRRNRVSKRAIEIIPRELRKNLTAHLNPDGVKAVIKRAIVQANEEIMAMGALDKDMKNMGTTVVMAIWRKGTDMFIAGVGDSRCYLVRDQKISQLTTDHSLAQALVEAKTISAAEAKEHRFKNVLWKYLGSKEVGDGPEVTVLQVKPHDRVMLCTDGLTGVVQDEGMQAFIHQQTDMQACAEGLGQLALDSGSRDNVSCIMIEVIDAA